jgi:hypothetical protein
MALPLAEVSKALDPFAVTPRSQGHKLLSRLSVLCICHMYSPEAAKSYRVTVHASSYAVRILLGIYFKGKVGVVGIVCP